MRGDGDSEVTIRFTAHFTARTREAARLYTVTYHYIPLRVRTPGSSAGDEATSARIFACAPFTSACNFLIHRAFSSRRLTAGRFSPSPSSFSFASRAAFSFASRSA